jgi:hypothetical protein
MMSTKGDRFVFILMYGYARIGFIPLFSIIHSFCGAHIHPFDVVKMTKLLMIDGYLL